MKRASNRGDGSQEKKLSQKWLMLVYRVPREPTSCRVYVWRKLKRLGLTQSFEVGYEVSPRGLAFLERSKRRKKSKR